VYRVCVSLFLFRFGQMCQTNVGNGVASAFLLDVSNQYILRRNRPTSIREGQCIFINPSSLCLLKAEDDVMDFPIGDSNDMPNDDDSLNTTSLWDRIQAREQELRQGIGKRYITRTQKGFLNVHDMVSFWNQIRCFVQSTMYSSQIVAESNENVSHEAW
jgi:hypothetical protein